MIKNITICASSQFFDDVALLQKKLEGMGFVVFTPILEGKATDYQKLNKQQQADTKQFFIDKHLEKIRKSDAILVANYEKNDVIDYIGANSFLEMAFAYVLEKHIFLLYSIPQQANTVEIEGLKPICLQGNLEQLQS